MVGIAAHETERQRESLPLAVRRVSYRVVLYYVGAIFVLGLNVSVLDPVLKERVFSSSGDTISPFILMVQRAGLGNLSGLINAVCLIAAWSVANINLYMAVRSFLLWLIP
jgi:amino acid permease